MKRVGWNPLVALLLAAVLVMNMLPGLAFADEGVSAAVRSIDVMTADGAQAADKLEAVTAYGDSQSAELTTETLTVAAEEPSAAVRDITVLAADGSRTAESVEAGSAYAVRVTVQNTGTDSLSAGVTLYEVRGGTETVVEETKDTGELTAEAEATLDFAWTPAGAGDCALKAAAAYGDGQSAELTTETLTVAAADEPAPDEPAAAQSVITSDPGETAAQPAITSDLSEAAVAYNVATVTVNPAGPSPVGDDEGLAGLLIYTGTTTQAMQSTAFLGSYNAAYPHRPVFDQKTTSYVLEETDARVNQTIRFAVVPAEAGATVTVYYGDGLAESKVMEPVSALTTHIGTNWARCAPRIGKNVFAIVVTPPDGSQNQEVTYTFTMYCAPTLSALSLSAGGEALPLDRAFAADVFQYGTTVPADITTVRVAATPTWEGYSLTYNGGAESDLDVSAADSIEIVLSVGEGDDTRSTTYTVSLNKVAAYDATIVPSPADAVVALYNPQGRGMAKNAQGAYTGLLSGLEYTYVVTKYGYVAATGAITGPDSLVGGRLDVALTEAPAPAVPLPDYDGEWTNFRGNDRNMGLTGAKTPVASADARLKWAKRLGTSWSVAPTPPIIVNDVLYVAARQKIYKLSKENGEILAESPNLAGDLIYAMNPVTYAEGVLFVPVDNGQIQALRADTLEILWLSEMVGGQTVCPITYRNGYIYAGTWNSETSEGVYYGIPVTDEDPTRSDETKRCSWKLTHPGGFYWAGAYATDNYLIFGSDDGSPRDSYTDTAVLYSVHPVTGEIIDTITGVKGDIRSTVSYDPGTDSIYFSTKGGWFYKVQVSEEGAFMHDNIKFLNTGGMSTGTPLVHNGRAYLGAAGPDQFSPSGHSYQIIDVNTMTKIYAADIPGYVQTSALLSTAYAGESGKVYLYVTYNYKPGGIFILEDSPGQTEPNAFHLFIPPTEMQEHCISSLVCDKDGTIYYKNDSAYLMAVERAGAEIGAAIDPDTAAFDKNPANQADVTAAITWNGATEVTDVKAGGTSIGETSYSVGAGTLTIKKDYLAAQPAGSLELTVEFDAGAPATLTVNITDTSAGGETGFTIERVGEGGFELGADARVILKITNNSTEPRPATLIVCLYDNQRPGMVNYSYLFRALAAGEEVELAGGFRIPGTGDFSVKAFVWDSFENMEPLLENPLVIEVD